MGKLEYLKTCWISIKKAFGTTSRPIVYSVSVLFVLVLFFLYTHFVISPQNFVYFSLIDDGQTIENSKRLLQCIKRENCASAGSVLIETEFGRFRPFYWIIQAFISNFVGIDSAAQHIFRGYVLGGILLIAMSVVIALFSNYSIIALYLSIFIFFTNYSFSENIIRLGPVEIYQLLFFILISIVIKYLKKSDSFLSFFLTILITLICLIKETSLVVVAILICWSLYITPKYEQKQKLIQCIFISFIPIVILFLGLTIANTYNSNSSLYASNYRFSAQTLYTNAKSYLIAFDKSLGYWIPLFLLTIIVNITFTVYLERKIITAEILYWFISFMFFTLILLPWQHVLERYMLISIFCFSILFSLYFVQTYSLLNDYFFKNNVYYLLFVSMLFIATSNVFFYSFSTNYVKTLNYSSWYSRYLEYENELIYVYTKLPQESYLNAKDILDNWEVLYELPLHTELITGNRKEVLLLSLDNQEFIENGTNILSTSSLIPLISINDTRKFILIEKKEYTIQQINVSAFQKDFIHAPVSSLLSPSFEEKPIKHFWRLDKKYEN